MLPGSASVDLLNQSGESLGGRIAFGHLFPFDVLEGQSSVQERLWVQCGFPAVTDETSAVWRENFIRACLERDSPQFDLRAPAETLGRFRTVLPHVHGVDRMWQILR